MSIPQALQHLPRYPRVLHPLCTGKGHEATASVQNHNLRWFLENKEIKINILLSRHPGKAQQETTLHAKTWSSTAKGISYPQSSSSVYFSEQW